MAFSVRNTHNTPVEQLETNPVVQDIPIKFVPGSTLYFDGDEWFWKTPETVNASPTGHINKPTKQNTQTSQQESTQNNNQTSTIDLPTSTYTVQEENTPNKDKTQNINTKQNNTAVINMLGYSTQNTNSTENKCLTNQPKIFTLLPSNYILSGTVLSTCGPINIPAVAFENINCSAGVWFRVPENYKQNGIRVSIYWNATSSGNVVMSLRWTKINPKTCNINRLETTGCTDIISPAPKTSGNISELHATQTHEDIGCPMPRDLLNLQIERFGRKLHACDTIEGKVYIFWTNIEFL